MSRDPAATREAFAQLLAQPLLTAARHPDAYTLVQRNRAGISVSATKFGYQVRSVGNAVRLDRIPLAGTVSHPPQADRRAQRSGPGACVPHRRRV